MGTNYRHVYTAADGESIDLNDGVSYMTLEFDGVGDLDPDIFSEEMPSEDGALLLGTRLPPRIVTARMLVMGTSFAERIAAERRLGAVLSPRRGEGTLAVAYPDGVVREISAVRQSGTNWSADGVIGPAGRRVALSYFCASPHFRATGRTEIAFAAQSGSAPKLNTAYTLAYDGTAPTPVEITVNGPAVNPYVRCVGPDGVTRTVGIAYTVPTGSSVVFNFTPGNKRITLNPDTSNVDLRGFATTVSGADSEFWNLQRKGDHTITIYESTPSGTATATLAFYPRFEAL